MKNGQIKQGFWKNKVVFFNGKQGIITGIKSVSEKNQFFIQFPNGKSKWVNQGLIVWN